MRALKHNWQSLREDEILSNFRAAWNFCLTKVEVNSGDTVKGLRISGKKLNFFWSSCTYVYWQEENEMWKFNIWGYDNPLKIGENSKKPQLLGGGQTPKN